jgi:hypothetical protein
VASAPNRLWPNLTGATILATGVWSWWLLGRNADWMPALRWVILGMGAAILAPLKAIRTRWSAPRSTDRQRRLASNCRPAPL